MATKLLLADDSVTIHKVVSLTFAAEDVTIDAVTDGNLAIEKAHADRPDIVLADVFMPGRNGYEVCAAIKSDPMLAGTPVVLLVGTFEPFDEQEATRVKCDAYLTKPFDTSELIQIVRHLVDQRGAAKAGVESAAAVSESQVAGRVACGAARDVLAAGLISVRTRESFLGEHRILELFDAPALELESAARIASPAENPTDKAPPEQRPAAPRQVIPFPGIRGSGLETSPSVLTEEAVDQIVEKVVRRMSQQVVREIAWEVVPALSEIMIRQYLDELRSSRKI
ncbi:MAG: response regulator [Acidobacteriia bacterium]|nr:response regulator [Terriglobia bacterium]